VCADEDVFLECGSCPILPGDDYKTGEITVKFVLHACRDRIYRQSSAWAVRLVTADETAET
jgi:hypothetical protein